MVRLFATSLCLTWGLMALGNAAKKEPKKAEKGVEACSFELHGNDMMKFTGIDGSDVKEIKIPKSCSKFAIELVHVGKQPKNVMGHNFFISETKDMQSLIGEALKDPKAEYILPASKVLAGSAKLLGGGDKESIHVDLAKLRKTSGDLSYFCSFPGHFGLMNGKVILEK